MTRLERPSEEASPSRGPETDSGARWVLLLSLAVGLVRFWKLGAWSLWFDEAATFTDWYVGLSGGEIKNPLGYELVHRTVELLGGRPDEYALRFLPALAGWLVIPATYWAFRELAGRRAAALAALFVATSSWQVYWSQNARFYTLAELATLVGAGLVLRGFARGSAVRALLGVAVAGAGALFHPSAALAVPALVVAPIFAARRAGRPVVGQKRVLLALGGAAVVGALVAFPWAKATLGTYFLQKGAQGPFDAGAALDRVLHLARTTGFYLTPYLGAAALVGAALAWRRRAESGLAAFAVALVVLVLVGAIAAAGARMTAQYVFFLFPWIALLAALPADELGRALADAGQRKALARAWAFVLVACSLVNTALYFTVRQGERPPWRDAYQFVWNRREENDLVLGMEATVGEYYVAPWRTELRQPEHVQWLDKWRATLPKLWARQSRRMWLVVNPEQFLDWNESDAAEVQRFLREECRLVKVWPLYVESRDLSVWVYVRD
ncbi:MAG: glycosyltransferase family 39 protein [Planctomycetes bacterium]|nr:glycosyltransferase family 39 protein [Planctomycetota bacterium]